MTRLKGNMKYRIAGVLKELCRTRKLDKITVNELVKTCGINKSTFYYHFIDIDDLIQWIWKIEVEDELIEPLPGFWKRNEEKLMRKWYEDYAFYKQAILSDSVNGLRNIYYNVLYRTATRYIQNACQNLPVKKEFLDFLAKYQAHAFCDLHIEYFLNHPDGADLDLFITMCYDTSEAWLGKIQELTEKWTGDVNKENRK